MASTSFTDHVTVIPTVWLNDVNSLVWGVFNGATTASLARTALGLGTLSVLNSPLPIANGGTASITASAAVTALGAVPTGTATASGLTMSTGKLLGRTTASSGAIEEITPGNGITLSSGTLSATVVSLGAPTSTPSGSSVTIGSIPVTAKRVTLSLNGVSTTGTANPIIQLGESGGLETTGYLASGSTISNTVSSSLFTTGFGITSSTAAAILYGAITFTLENATSNTWSAYGVIGESDTPRTFTVAGIKALSGPLTQIAILTTDAFDGGEINISYI